MAGEDGGEEVNLEFTPTWVVAVVCTVIVFISFFVERFLHYLGKILKKKNQKPLYEALLKVKEELMLLGFISLLLTVLQGAIQNICIPRDSYDHMLPCKKEEDGSVSSTEHYQSSFFDGVLGSGRRLLSGGGSAAEHCAHKGKIPLLSLEALHQLHIFIFVLAISHVTFCVLTMVLGSLRIQQWKHWEDSIQKELKKQQGSHKKVTHIHQHEFIQKRFKGLGKDSFIIRWLSTPCGQPSRHTPVPCPVLSASPPDQAITRAVPPFPHPFIPRSTKSTASADEKREAAGDSLLAMDDGATQSISLAPSDPTLSRQHR